MNNMSVPGAGRQNFFLYWLAQQGKQAQNNPARGAAPMTKAQWKNMEQFERVRAELRDNEQANLAYNVDEMNRRGSEYDMAKMGYQGDVEKDMFSHGATTTADTFERLNPGLAAQNKLDADRIEALRAQEEAARQAGAQAEADATPSPFDSAETTLKAQDEAAESGDATTAAPGGVQAPVDRSPLDRSATPYTRQTVTPNLSAGLGQGISGKLFTTASDAELTADKQGRVGLGRGGPAEVGGPKEKGKGKGEKGKEGEKVKEETAVDPVQQALEQVRMRGAHISATGRRSTPSSSLSKQQMEQARGSWDEYVANQASDLTKEDYPEVAQALATNMFSDIKPEDIKDFSKAQRDRLEDFVVRKPTGGPAEPPKAEEEPAQEPVVEKPKSKGGGRKKKQEAPADGPVKQEEPVKEEPVSNPPTESTPEGGADNAPPPMGFDVLGKY
jgi:hypothetical protein